MAERYVSKTIWESLDITWDIIGGTLSFAFELLLNYQVFLLLFFTAEAVIYIRWFIVHSTTLAEVVVGILLILFEAIRIGWDIIAAAICGLTLGAHCPKYLPVTTKDGLFGGDWYEEVKKVPETCVDYTEWQTVFGYFVGQLTKGNVCVFLRYVEPVGWLYDIMHGLLGWVSLDPMPKPGHNCEDTADELLCAVLGIGYLILQLIIPVMIALLAIKSYGPLLRKILLFVFHALFFLLYHFPRRLLRGEYAARHFFSDVKQHIELYHEKLHERWARHEGR